MHKKRLHHSLVRLRQIRYSYLIALFVLLFGLFVYAYRQNNLTAIKLRDELLVADEQNGDVEAALKKLREHTYSHMNATLDTGPNGIYPPIQLKYRYERLVAAEQQRVSQANTQLYTQAQAYCEQQVTSRRTTERVPCIQEYLANNGVIVPAAAVPDALYKFAFVSPVWSPDLAGLSLLASLVVLILLLARWLSEAWLRYSLRR